MPHINILFKIAENLYNVVVNSGMDSDFKFQFEHTSNFLRRNKLNKFIPEMRSS